MIVVLEKWQYSKICWYIVVGLYIIFDLLNTAFQKPGKLYTIQNYLLSNRNRLLNQKGPGTRHQSSKWFKLFPKDIDLNYVY